jgi:hypothetical protein
MNDLTLIGAVKNGDFAEAEALIKGGADVNQEDEQGWTPLNFAAGKGDLALVKLLVESGADMFKVGRDKRTPYMIALAASHASVAKYLRRLEVAYSGEKLHRKQRKYCKAYHLADCRKYLGWSESRINWKDDKEKSESDVEGALADDQVVFIHQDLTVTESMWHNENVIFNAIDPIWEEFCANTLGFKVPDDLDLIGASEERAGLND